MELAQELKLLGLDTSHLLAASKRGSRRDARLSEFMAKLTPTMSKNDLAKAKALAQLWKPRPLN